MKFVTRPDFQLIGINKMKKVKISFFLMLWLLLYLPVSQ